jgi:hypothetical protein
VLGERGSVVDPPGCETGDDLRLQLRDQSLRVVVCERSCQAWVVAGLLLVAEDPLDSLGELSQIVEGGLPEPDFGHFGNVSELVAVAGANGLLLAAIRSLATYRRSVSPARLKDVAVFAVLCFRFDGKLLIGGRRSEAVQAVRLQDV